MTSQFAFGKAEAFREVAKSVICKDAYTRDYLLQQADLWGNYAKALLKARLGKVDFKVIDGGVE